MSYRCEVCKTVVQKGRPQRKFVEKRRDGSILKETPVCESCFAWITREGETPESVIRRRRENYPSVPKSITRILWKNKLVIPFTLPGSDTKKI